VVYSRIYAPTFYYLRKLSGRRRENVFLGRNEKAFLAGGIVERQIDRPA